MNSKTLLISIIVFLLGGCEVYTDESGHPAVVNAFNDKAFVDTALRKAEAEQNNQK
jgi:hypothetical protein